MRPSIRTLIVVLATAALSACVTVTRSALSKRDYIPERRDAPEIVYAPKVNSEAEAEVGESMVSTSRRTVVPGIKLKSEVVHPGENLGHQYTLMIPRGALLAASAHDSEGVFFLAEKPLDFAADGTVVQVSGGVYVPNVSPSSTEIFWLGKDRVTGNDAIEIRTYGATHAPLTDEHPHIQFEPTQIERWGVESFKRELVYGGTSENTVTVLYREFSDNIARPAFSQELKYDLSKGDVIGFRGARFQVLKVTNTAIKFKPLKHLE